MTRMVYPVPLERISYPQGYNTSGEIVKNFFENKMHPSDLNNIAYLDIQKIIIFETADAHDIKLPSYKMLRVTVFTLSHTDIIKCYVLDVPYIEREKQTPEVYIRRVIDESIYKLIIVTESAFRRDDNRLVLVRMLTS